MGTSTNRAVSLEVLAASADIPQRRFVTFKATAGLALPAIAGDSALIAGVTLEAYDDSEADLGNASTVIPVAVLDGGPIEIEAGEELTVGMVVVSGNDGRAVETTTTAGGTVPAGLYQQLGSVIKGAPAAGDVAEILPFRGAFVTTS